MMHDSDLSSDTPAAVDLRAEWAADPSASKTRKQCAAIGNWSKTTQIEKEKRGLLHRYVDGATVRITTASLFRHLIDLANAPPRRARQAPPGFGQRKKSVRARTQAELDGLARANARRHADKLKRDRARKEAADA
jgi:hypothetical protein